MSLIPVTLSNATDTWVNQQRPAINYSDGTLLRVAATSGTTLYSYIYFSRPFPLGATITSAVLHLRQVSALTGSRTVTARRVRGPWKVSRLSYSNQPTIDTAVAASVTKTGGAAGTSWDFDVTSTMQLVSDGGAWYGFRIETTDTTQHQFWSAQAASNKPTLEVTWTDTPDAPSTLSPAGNRSVSLTQPTLRFDFTDHVGNTALQAIQVQANATNTWTAPTFDSDVVQTASPQLDLSQTFPVAMTVTTTSASTTITTPATPGFTASDVGAKITGTGIPANATITAVASATSATMSAAATASGTIAATVTETFPAMADASTMYWRVRVQDGAGVWSPWSLAAMFSRVSKGTLTITNPAAAPNDNVSDATPTITWTFTGRIQYAYQVIVTDAAGKWVYNSGKITGTQTSATVKRGVIHEGIPYTAYVRIWDTVSRENTPGDAIYVQASRPFTYILSSTVASVTNLTGTDLTPVPAVQLDWNRFPAPNAFNIVRYEPGATVKRTIYSNLDPSDLFVGGTAYRFVDRGADPNVPHVWEVRAVVNNVTSGPNPSVTKTLKPAGIWILDPDTGISVQLVGSDNGSWANGEDAEVYTPVGGTRVVRVTQALRGFEGSIQGELISFGSTDVQTSVANMYTLKENAGATYWLTVQDFCIPVIIGNVTIAPIRGTEVRKAVSFDFWQVGDTPFDATL